MNAINPKIQLIAIVSRLIDLHDSDREPGQNTKSIPSSKRSDKNSAFYLNLGILVLESLYKLERENGIGTFHSHTHIASIVTEMDTDYDIKDIDYCLRFLSMPRKIWFVSEETSRDSSTTDITQLIKSSVGEYHQYCLTEYARLFFRVSAATKDWFYEGEEANKIVAALRNGFFDDVPVFCNQRIESLLSFCKKITTLKQRASFDNAAQEFFDMHAVYEKALGDARQAITEASSLLSNDEVFEAKWEAWHQRTGMDHLTPQYLLKCLHRVAKMSETANRMLVDFVTNIHKYKAAGIGLVDFHAYALDIIKKGLPIDILHKFCEVVMPTVPQKVFFHPFDWRDIVDLDVRTEYDASYTIDLEAVPAATLHERFASFIDRNRQWLMDTLLNRNKGITFSELLDSGKFSLLAGESPAMLYGFCANPSSLDIEFSITVRLVGGAFRRDVEDTIIYGDDIEIVMDGNKRSAK